jgi:hypothetical protein
MRSPKNRIHVAGATCRNIATPIPYLEGTFRWWNILGRISSERKKQFANMKKKKNKVRIEFEFPGVF